jgi:hypothetical protein
MGALPMYRQPVPVAQAAVRANIHEAFDIYRHLAAQGTFDLEIILDDIPDPDGLLLGEILRLELEGDLRLLKNFPGTGPSDTEDRGQCNLNVLVVGQIDSDYSRHKNAPFDFRESVSLTLDAACASGSCRSHAVRPCA